MSPTYSFLGEPVSTITPQGARSTGPSTAASFR